MAKSPVATRDRQRISSRSQDGDMPLKILITNNTLDGYAGSECYARDVARYMASRGHFVLAYSTKLGAVATEIEKYGCLVTDTLNGLSFVPDIIHGHHHLDATCAMVRFPGVPSIYITHGILPWEESPPPVLSRIMRYICISEGTQRALLLSHPEVACRTEIIPNFACAEIFQSRRNIRTAAARTMLRTLIYGNYEPKELVSIREVCHEMGAVCDEIGEWSVAGNRSNPQDFLPNYDLVFAYGRSAIEAIFCGCEVIMTHETGTGDLVTDINFASLRARGFGFTTCQNVIGKQGIKTLLETVDQLRTIGGASLDDVNRQLLDSEQYLARLESIYYEAIAEWHGSHEGCDTSLADSIALSKYLAKIKLRYGFDRRELELAKGKTEQARVDAVQAEQETKTAKEAAKQAKEAVKQAKEVVLSTRAEAKQARVEADQARLALDQIRIEAAQVRQEACRQEFLARQIMNSKIWRATYPFRRFSDIVKARLKRGLFRFH